MFSVKNKTFKGEHNKDVLKCRYEMNVSTVCVSICLYMCMQSKHVGAQQPTENCWCKRNNDQVISVFTDNRTLKFQVKNYFYVR